jgi:glucose-fructose oxidoreductase
VNAARYATGLEPVALRAWDETARRDIFHGVDETMRFRLEFPDDIVAECTTSFGRNLNTLQVDCERGWYMMSPFQGYEGNAGRASDGTVFEPQLGKTPRMQAEQMDQDALAILDGTAPRVPGEEGVADLRVLDAAFASARGNGERVAIAR